MPLMDDLKELALKLFEIEKNLLLKEKQEYSCAEVIVITPEERYYEDCPGFDDVGEKDAVYGAIAERAKAKNAIAIITINICRTKNIERDEDLNSYWWGQLAA